MPDTLDHLLRALREAERALGAVREDLARHDERHKLHDERHEAVLAHLDALGAELAALRTSLGDKVDNNHERISRWHYGAAAVAGFLTLAVVIVKGWDALVRAWSFVFGGP